MAKARVLVSHDTIDINAGESAHQLHRSIARAQAGLPQLCQQLPSSRLSINRKMEAGRSVFFVVEEDAPAADATVDENSSKILAIQWQFPPFIKFHCFVSAEQYFTLFHSMFHSLRAVRVHGIN